MIKPFQFTSIPKIYFRAGGLASLPDMIKSFGSSVILVTGAHSFIDSINGESFLKNLRNAGIKYFNFIVPGEPSPELIDIIVSEMRGETVNSVVGIGGGSAVDAGKAVSAMMYKSGSVMDYLEGVGKKEHPGTKIPYIAVPTTSGTGSEATKNAVISRTGKKGFKKSLRHDNLIPDIALVDPELTLNCPRDITAAGGMDCFTQLTEAFLSDKSNSYTDALAVEGLKQIKSSLIRTVRDGNDLEARTGMSFAALTSGICLANAGLGVVHGFASVIGGMYNIPHGQICGTLMAVANEITVRNLRNNPARQEALSRYALLGKLFLGESGRSDDHYIDGFIDWLHILTSELQLPGLKQTGVVENDLKEISSLTECKNNPARLNDEELLEILIKRLY